MFSGISATTGKNGRNKPSDLFATKEGLAQTGDWNPVNDLYDHPTSEPQKAFDTAVEGFQGRFGLKKDGLMMPGGPTETTLKAETAKLTRENAGLPKAPDPIRLKAPVGLNQANRPEDIAPVQTAFQALAQPKLGLSQLAGTPPTVETFQSKFGLKPDGILVPGGPTEQTLNRLAGPIMAAQEQAALTTPLTEVPNAPIDETRLAVNEAFKEESSDTRKTDVNRGCEPLVQAVEEQSQKLEEALEVRDHMVKIHSRIQQINDAIQAGSEERKASIALSNLDKFCDLSKDGKYLLHPLLRRACQIVDTASTLNDILSPDRILQEFIALRMDFERELRKAFLEVRTQYERLEVRRKLLDQCQKDRAP